MNIDQQMLSARSWAIPAISGLSILHHDFKTPRLAKVHRLVWFTSSVEVHLQYGICNLSGKVIDSIDIVVTLHREGAVGIRMAQEAVDNPKKSLLKFIAGEVYREARRWAEEMESWVEDDIADADHASILSIVSALIAHPMTDMHVTIEKDPLRPGCVRKARLTDDTCVTEITSFGVHGVNLYVKGGATHAGMPRLHQEHDMRQGSAQAKTACARFLKDASLGARRLMLFPFDMLHYLSERRQMSATKISSDLVEYLPASFIDARAGESLSALSS